jgi:hypothetical protein
MQVAEKSLVNARTTIEHHLVNALRDEGYVPCLDLDSIWVQDFDATAEAYDCTLHMYFVYVGRKKAWEVQGITSGKTIPMSTPPKKSV